MTTTLTPARLRALRMMSMGQITETGLTVVGIRASVVEALQEAGLVQLRRSRFLPSFYVLTREGRIAIGEVR